MKKRTLHIGLDDTDSTKRGCTTYVAALLVEQLEEIGASFLDYPNLIRLNPNVPWKTRGNGALCLRIEHDEKLTSRIKEATINMVEEQADFEAKGTDPGIVFFDKQTIPKEITIFAKKATTGIVTLKEALRLINKFKGEALGFNTYRGIIGALAAIGETLQEDYTYELIAYRAADNCGSKRKVDEDSIFQMDALTKPYTFNNIDTEKRRLIITPRGPDPILFGVRGENPHIVKEAFTMIKPLEPVERWVIFRSNQGTDAHLKRVPALNQLKPYSSIIAKGVVSQNPWIVPLRHVIFPIRDESGKVDCAAYEPTGVLRKVAMKLVVGDSVEVYGAVRKSSASKRLTVNLEKIRVIGLAPKIVYNNPLCAKCGRRLKSMGKAQGFRCEKCGSRYSGLAKVAVAVERDLKTGLYVTSTRSQRHLTKPLRRYGLEKSGWTSEKLIDEWHSFQVELM
ncbi:MAG: tRNA(Ile)(2)-agmatinylcytidine synthase [Candidatus Bathyarchaeota archaeon]|nr:tRNA(Ile)(2)-agmatinylcytidine synthase [Candidatus Bathyarchaeota archaeon]